MTQLTFGDLVSGLGLAQAPLGTILDDLGSTDSNPLVTLLLNAGNVGELLSLAGLTDAPVFPGLASTPACSTASTSAAPPWTSCCTVWTSTTRR